MKPAGSLIPVNYIRLPVAGTSFLASFKMFRRFLTCPGWAFQRWEQSSVLLCEAHFCFHNESYTAY